MGRFGAEELLVVLAIVVLFFGGEKIPKLMRGIGEGVREFRKGVAEAKESSRPD